MDFLGTKSSVGNKDWPEGSLGRFHNTGLPGGFPLDPGKIPARKNGGRFKRGQVLGAAEGKNGELDPEGGPGGEDYPVGGFPRGTHGKGEHGEETL